MTDRLLLGVDVGTASTKGVLDADGRDRRRPRDGARAVGAATRVAGSGPAFAPPTKRGVPSDRILYGVDTRATAEIDEFDALLGRDEILRRTGSVVTSRAVGPKLLWFSTGRP
jgi:xylulokinase